MAGWPPVPERDAMNPDRDPATASHLLIDLYQLTMLQAYLDEGTTDTAVFELFFRTLPPRRGFLMTAGLAQALDFLADFRFGADEIAWLRQTGRFSERLLATLETLEFTGDVDAMPEGTIFFADEPVLRVVAPLPQAQLAETRLLNIIHFQTLIASKAARCTLAAPGKTLIDFGLRRAHGAEAGLLAARAAYIAGFDGSANLLAEREFGIPSSGTMAHSFIQAHDSESGAFRAFARSNPDNTVLLLDTYDTEEAARLAVRLVAELAANGIRVRAVRLDSGDLDALSRRVRAILDAAGQREISIFASGGIDEDQLAGLARAGAPIDGFGVGTSLTTSSDVAALDCAYKLQEYAGIARRKRSTGKATWPGRKQVWRRHDGAGTMAGDTIALETGAHPGDTLLQPAMRGGRRVAPDPDLAAIRARARRQLDALPPPAQQLNPGFRYPVTIADDLRALAAQVDARVASARKD
jgi:nicotinate phosphoribosyltransferase